MKEERRERIILFDGEVALSPQDGTRSDSLLDRVSRLFARNEPNQSLRPRPEVTSAQEG